MLVLSRKKNDVVKLSPDGKLWCDVVVVEIRGDKVRLGFEAPQEWIYIQRKEVHDLLQQEQQQAQAQSSPPERPASSP